MPVEDVDELEREAEAETGIRGRGVSAGAGVREREVLSERAGPFELLSSPLDDLALPFG